MIKLVFRTGGTIQTRLIWLLYNHVCWTGIIIYYWYYLTGSVSAGHHELLRSAVTRPWRLSGFPVTGSGRLDKRFRGMTNDSDGRQ